jgi:hypothetical protein
LGERVVEELERLPAAGGVLRPKTRRGGASISWATRLRLDGERLSELAAKDIQGRRRAGWPAARFVAQMDQLMPQWRIRKEQLNQLPVRHENWGY